MSNAAAVTPETGNVHGHCFSTERRWNARMDLDFAVRQGRTTLMRMNFAGPLRVQRPFYPEAAPPENSVPGMGQRSQPCHCCLLHPPGGLVSGDNLHLEARLSTGAHVLLTAPSASKFYAADSCNVPQRQSTALHVEGGVLEWLPRETIIYDGARAEMVTEVHLDAESVCMGWETVCLGRPAAGESFTHGSLHQRLRLTRHGRPLLHETLRMEGGDELQHGPFGLDGQTVCATLFAAGRTAGPDEAAAHDAAALAACCEKLQTMLVPREDDLPETETSMEGGNVGAPASAPSPAPLPDVIRDHAGATMRGGVLVLRYLGPDVEAARTLLLTAWRMLRPALTGCEAHMPRIWHGAF